MKPAFKFTKLSTKSRFALAGVIYAIVSVSQLLFLQGNTIPESIIRWAGFVLLLIPLYILVVRNFSNKPQDLGKEEWKPVTMKEIDRITDRIQKVRKAPISLTYNKTFAILITIITATILFFMYVDGNRSGLWLAIDIYIIFIPFLWFAQIIKWYPSSLAKELRNFNVLITYPFPKTVKLVPYLRFDEDKEGQKIPESFKAMLEPVPKPDDVVGVQFQLTYNNGPNGAVPYMYAVFLTKGKATSWKKLKTISYKNFVVDASSSIENKLEYGTVVLRLNPTCRSDGYHTKESDIQNLIRNVIDALNRL